MDWFNLMAYDFHGGWDDVTGPHSPLYADDGLSIDHAVQLYLAAGVPPSKIVGGMSLYGRGWTLKSTDKMEYGVPTTGTSKAGVCTQEAGILNQLEIQSLVGANYRVDKPTQTVIGWSGNQFITYDNEETLAAKVDYYCKHKVGGVMTWAMSMDLDYKLMKHVYERINACTDTEPEPSPSPAPPTPEPSPEPGDCPDVAQCDATVIDCLKHTKAESLCKCTEAWLECLAKTDC